MLSRNALAVRRSATGRAAAAAAARRRPARRAGSAELPARARRARASPNGPPARAAAAARSTQPQQHHAYTHEAPKEKKSRRRGKRRCPSTAALSLIVKVGKMFVCIETVGRAARSAAAPASVDASKVRAMVLRIIYSVSLRCPAIHVVFRKSRARALMRGCGDIMAVRGELLVAVSVAWVADLWRSAAARPCSWLALISCWMRARVLHRF